MNRRTLVAVLIGCGLAPPLLDHLALRTASDDLHHGGLLERRLVPGRHALLPGLRALFVQLWLVRIDSAIRQGRRDAALRFAREAIAVGPDLDVGRVRVAHVLAFDVAASEPAPAARVAWISEAIRILDDGLLQNPQSAVLHFARGQVILWRGVFVPEFREAFQSSHGRSTLQEAADSLRSAARIDRFDMFKLNCAASALRARAEESVARAKGREAALADKDSPEFELLVSDLESARLDFRDAADFLRTVKAIVGTPKQALSLACEICEVSSELAALNAKGARDGLSEPEQALVSELRRRRNEIRKREEALFDR